MATYLDRDTYNSFKGANVLADLADQYHAQIDQATSDPPTSSDSLTNPLGTAGAVSIPAPAIPSPSPATPEPATPAPAVASANPTGLVSDSTLPGPAPVTPSAPITAPLSRAPLNDISQFGQAGVSYDEALAACGPAAAVRLASTYGNNIPLRDVVAAARQSGLWDAASGMHGIDAEKKLLDQMHISAKVDYAPDPAKIIADAQNGNTVTLSTPNHYFTITGYDPQSGLFDVGQSGTAYRTGSARMSWAQIKSIGGGINGALFVDNPTTPTPSIAAGQQGDTSAGGTPPAGGALPPAASTSPLDTLAADLHAKIDAAGQVKDDAAQSLNDLANSFHAKLNEALNEPAGTPASAQPTPSDTLTNPTLRAGSVDMREPPPPQPTVFDRAGEALSNLPTPTILNGGMNLANAAVPATDESASTMPTGGALVTQAAGDYERQRLADDQRANTIADQGASASPEDRAWLDKYNADSVMGIAGIDSAAGGETLGALSKLVSRYSPEERAGFEEFVQKMSAAGQKPEDIGNTIRKWMDENPPPASATAAPAAAPAEAAPARTNGAVGDVWNRPAAMEPLPARAEAPAPATNAVPAPQAMAAKPMPEPAYTPLPGESENDAFERAIAERRAQMAGSPPNTPPPPTAASAGDFETSRPPSEAATAAFTPKTDWGKVAWGGLAEAKKTLFSLSNFHPAAITQGMFFGPAGPQGAAQFAGAYVKGIFKPGATAARATGDLAEWFQKAEDAGALRNVGVNPETGTAAKGVLSPLARTIAQAAGSGLTAGVAENAAAKNAGASDEDAFKAALFAGGIGAALGPTLAMRMHNALWTEAVPLAKVLTFKAAVKGGVAPEEAAMFTKNLIGGQNLQAIAGSTGAELARLAFMAPDWLLSQGKLIRDAGIGIAKSVPGVENLPKMGGAMTGSQQLSRDWMLKAVGTGLLATEAAQLAFTGHFTNENQPGNAFKVQVGNQTYSLFPGNIQGELDLLSNRDPGRFIENRLGIAGTAGNVIANQQYPGSHNTIFPPGAATPEQVKDVTGYGLSRYASLGMTAPQQQYNQGAPVPAIAASVLTGLKIGHVAKPSAPAPAGRITRNAPAPVRPTSRRP